MKKNTIYCLFFLLITGTQLWAWPSSDSPCYAWNALEGTPVGDANKDMSPGGFSLTGYRYTNFNANSRQCGYYQYETKRFADLKIARDLFVLGLRNFVNRVNEYPELGWKWQTFPLADENLDYTLRFNNAKSSAEAPTIEMVLIKSNYRVLYTYRSSQDRLVHLHEESWEEAVSRVESASLSEALAKLALTREEAMERFYGIKQPDQKDRIPES